MTAPNIDIAQIPARFQPLMQALAHGAIQISAALQRHRPGGQKPADMADGLMQAAMQGGAGLRHYVSPALRCPLTLDTAGDLALAIDPLSGAEHADSNMVLGTIFGIFAAGEDASASFLRAGRDLLAAGYVIYGPRCCLLVSFGGPVQSWQFAPDSNRFDLIETRTELSEGSFAFAIDAANYRHWPRPIRAYIDDCLAGSDGPRERNFNMRWTASLVAEAHRILSQGGIFLDPGDTRQGRAHDGNGPRRLFHAAPIAFLIEHAGGRASDGALSILDAPITDFDETTPLVFGTRAKVDRVAAYHDLPEAEVSALFGNRGLFRA